MLASTHIAEIEAVIHVAIAEWTEGNAERFAALFSEGGEFIVPGDRWVGKAEIEQITADFVTQHDVFIEVKQIVVQDKRAAVEWHWQDINRQTGDRNVADDVIMIDFSGSEIQRWREYIDEKTPAIS